MLSLSLDLAAIIAAFYAAAAFRDYAFPALLPLDLVDHKNILVISLPIFAFSLYNVGLYEKRGSRTLVEDLRLTVRAMLSALIVLVLMIFVMKYSSISRVFLVLFGILSLLLVMTARLGSAALSIKILGVRKDRQNILVVGTGERAREFIRTITQSESNAFCLRGIVTDGLDVSPEAGAEILGRLEDLPDIVERGVIDSIVFAVPHESIPAMSQAFAYCMQVGIVPCFLAQPFKDYPGHAEFQYVAGTPLIAFTTTRQNVSNVLTKRLFDICFSSAVLIAFIPFAIWIGIMIKRGSPGPIVFRQTRVGRNGRLFTLYKFRTMRSDAEELRRELLTHNEMDGPVFKMRDDPRITQFGRFLRRTSLDEFPQFLNVFLGNMSVVGPRPPLPLEVARYELWQRRRLSVKPGITGLWQVSGRNDIDFESWMKLDLHYIDNWSWLLDLKILIRTLPSMLKGY